MRWHFESIALPYRRSLRYYSILPVKGEKFMGTSNNIIVLVLIILAMLSLVVVRMMRTRSK